MNRIEKYHTLRELLKSITTNVYDVCVNGNTEFNKKLDKIRQIGYGAFGKIYLAILNDHEFVIKEGRIFSSQSNKINQNKLYTEILPKESYVEEYKIMELLSEYVVNGGFPNFILSYNAAVCETCIIPFSRTCFITFMEPAMCDFEEFLNIPEGEEMISNVNSCYSIVYQLFLSLCILHLKYGIFHQDLHSQNILVLPVTPGGYFRYIMNGKEYFVENHGYLFCIHDFGQSQVLHPDYSSREFYGTRNVLVNQDGLLEPINCDNSSVIGWLDGRVGTNNVFSDELYTSDNVVDLTDMKKFPPMEFYKDIRKILYQFKDLPKIRSIYTPSFPYHATSAMYLRADMMFDYLYEDLMGVTNDDIIQTFHLT
jgi:serine/threonine protein kinase